MPKYKAKQTKKGLSRFFSWFLLGALVVGVGVTVLLVRQDQDIRQTAAEASSADITTSSHFIMPGFNIYAPEVLYDEELGVWKMWFGGWLKKVHGPDEIYYSWSKDKVNWTAPAMVFRHPDPGVMANDPSIIKHSPNLYVMFYTAGIESQKATGVFNFVYYALSSDGVHWGSVKPLIGRNNGVNNGGAWAPSAVVHDNKYYIYYHDQASGGTQVLLSIFDFNFNLLSSKRITDDNAFRVNVDVKKVGDIWYMFYDTAKPGGGFKIQRIQSADGINWDLSNVTEVVTPPNDPNISALTPFALFDPTDTNRYSVFFGYGNAINAKDSTIHMREMEIATPIVIATPTPTPENFQPTVAAQSVARLRINKKTINVTIRQGQTRHVANLVSTGSTMYNFLEDPVKAKNVKIRWAQPRKGNLRNGQSLPIKISVPKNTKPGRYKGTAVVLDMASSGSRAIRVPVTVRVVER